MLGAATQPGGFTDPLPGTSPSGGWGTPVRYDGYREVPGVDQNRLWVHRACLKVMSGGAWSGETVGVWSGRRVCDGLGGPSREGSEGTGVNTAVHGFDSHVPGTAGQPVVQEPGGELTIPL